MDLPAPSANPSAPNPARTPAHPFGPGGQHPVEVPNALESLQGEITLLHEEVDALRRRDEVVNFYMHRLDEEMRLAARLQRDFLPKTLPQVGRVRFQTLFRPAGYVSGDLYDIMRLDETHVGFYIADAVGHGMPAALLTMFMKNALITKHISSSGYELLPPSQTMAHLNESLVAQNLAHATFATAIYGVVDTESLRVTYARGGHPNPIVLRHNGGMECLQIDGSLLGIFPDEQFPEATIQLEPGDRMLVFTDGIEVSFNEEPSLDCARWREELWSRRALGTEELIQDLVRHLDNQSGSLAPQDDLTMIVIDALP